MKRLAFLVLVASWSASGCLGLDTLDFEKRPKVVEEVAAPPTPPPPPVLAAQVTEANAAQMADALREELDREAMETPAVRRP